MSEADNPLEPFKRAMTATMRAMGGTAIVTIASRMGNAFCAGIADAR